MKPVWQNLFQIFGRFLRRYNAHFMKIFLIGYRCTGKTTIGKILAEILDFKFIDTDRSIENHTGLTILQIVEQDGWEKFRQIEKNVLLGLENLENQVIATGGGIIINPENRQFIRKNGVSVWLDADFNTIWHRITSDKNTPATRPPLSLQPLFQETQDLLTDRKPLYEQIGTIKIDTGCHTPLEIARIIERRLSYNARQ
jgi:shikimate kinase